MQIAIANPVPSATAPIQTTTAAATLATGCCDESEARLPLSAFETPYTSAAPYMNHSGRLRSR